MLRFLMVAILALFVAASPLLAQKTGTETEIKAKNKKSPVLACALSLYPIFSGGQFYNRQYKKGLMMVGIQATGMVLALQNFCLEGAACSSSTSGNLGSLAFWGGYLWSVIDAPISATESINSISNQIMYIYWNSMAAELHLVSILLSGAKAQVLDCRFIFKGIIYESNI